MDSYSPSTVGEGEAGRDNPPKIPQPVRRGPGAGAKVPGALDCPTRLHLQAVGAQFTVPGWLWVGTGRRERRGGASVGPCCPQGAGLTVEPEIRLWGYLHLRWLSGTGRA